MNRRVIKLRAGSWGKWWSRWVERNRIDADAEFKRYDLASAFRAGFKAGASAARKQVSER